MHSHDFMPVEKLLNSEVVTFDRKKLLFFNISVSMFN